MKDRTSNRMRMITSGAIAFMLLSTAMKIPAYAGGDQLNNSPLRWDHLSMNLRIIEKARGAIKIWRTRESNGVQYAAERAQQYETLLLVSQPSDPKAQFRAKAGLLFNMLLDDYLWDPHTDPYRD